MQRLCLELLTFKKILRYCIIYFNGKTMLKLLSKSDKRSLDHYDTEVLWTFTVGWNKRNIIARGDRNEIGLLNRAGMKTVVCSSNRSVSCIHIAALTRTHTPQVILAVAVPIKFVDGAISLFCLFTYTGPIQIGDWIV